MKAFILIIILFLLFLLYPPVYAEQKILYSLNTSDNALIRVDGVWVHDTGHLITNGIGEEGIAIGFSNQTNNYEFFYGSGNDSYLDLGAVHNISEIILYCGNGVGCNYDRYFMFYGSDNPNTNFTYVVTIPVRTSSQSYSSTLYDDAGNVFGRYRYLRWRWSINGVSVPDAVSNVLFDELEVYYSTFTLNGHVTNNLNNSVSNATITLNNSGGSTTSNDTGYYKISGIESGTFNITVTSPTYEDYLDIVSITADTEKNINMTETTFILSNISILSTTDNSITIGWDASESVDNVKVYRDTNTNLIGQTTSTLYTDSNLAPGTSYDYWLEPWVGASSGSKYPISGTTDWSGGPGPDPTPQPTPQPTSYPEPDHGGGSVFIGDIHITIPDFFNSPLWIIAIFMLLSLACVITIAEHGKKK